MKPRQLLGTVLLIAYAFSIQKAYSSEPAVLPVCESCHGEAGVSINSMVPTLAGQPYTLIEDNLLAFRAGGRVCKADMSNSDPDSMAILALAKTMCDSVAGLSDDDIVMLASFFESQPFEAAAQAFDVDSASQGSVIHVENGCDHCHSSGGTQSNAMAPILSGQWTPYLRHAMNRIRTGDKKGPKIMNAAIHKMNESEIEALLHFYASGHGGME